MFFLLRMAFWLSIVLILLPTGSTQRVQSGNDVGASEAISAASATVQDMRGFCTRQPDACSVGSQVAVSLVIFCVIYALIFLAGAVYIYLLLQRGPVQLQSFDGAATNPKRPLSMTGRSPGVEAVAPILEMGE